MAVIFDVNGNKVKDVYDINGADINTLYNVDGGVLTNDLVVMSFNIQRWKGINADANIIDEILRKYHPDIIGFQEYDTSKTLGGVGIADFLANRFPYLVVGDTKITNYTKAVSLSHEPFDVSTVYYTQSFESRSYQKMYITYSGKRIAVYNTHFDVQDSYKRTEAKELFDAVSGDEYFIIIGDLNTVCLKNTDADYVDMVAQFANAGYNLANCSEKFGFLPTCSAGTTANATDWKPRDHIITSANIEITDVIVDQLKVEANTGLTIDHLPLIAYLRVN